MPITPDPPAFSPHGRARPVVLGLLALLVLALVGAALLLWQRTEDRRHALSEQPAEGGAAAGFETRTSQFGLSLRVPLARLQALVNEQLPASFSQEGAGDDACATLLGQRVCAATQYRYTVTRGSVSLEPRGPEALHLEVPLSLRGQGGFSNAKARALNLDARPFEADAVLDLDLALAMGRDWCPQLSLTPSVRWTRNPRVEVVHRVWVDVRQPVQKAIDARLPALVEKARSAIDCERLRGQVQQVYGTRSLPVALPWNEHLALNLEPLGLALSGLQVEAAQLRLDAVVSARAAIAASAVPEARLPLPPLQRIATGSTAPRLQLALPVHLPYAQLTQALQQALLGKTYGQDTPAGRLQATIQGVRAYPSAERLVVALDFVAQVPGRLLDVRGSVFVAGRPAVEAGGTVLAFQDLGFTRILDHGLWDLVSALFEDEIRQALARAARVDLAPRLDQARERLLQRLHQLGRKDDARAAAFHVSASEARLHLGRVAVAPDALVLEALFGARLQLTLDAAP